MPLLGKEVIDVSYATGFATSPAQAGVAGGAAVGKPFVPNPYLPPDRYGVLDISISPVTGVLSPAPKGSLLVMQTATNPFAQSAMISGSPALSLALNNLTTGGGFWAAPTSTGTGNELGNTGGAVGGPSAPMGESMRGIVEQVGLAPTAFPNTSPAQYPKAVIVVRGPVQALCVAPTTGNGISIGSPLCSDGNGNLQPLPIPTSVPTIATGTSFGISTTAACPAWALVAVSKDGMYSSIGANFGTSCPVSLGNVVAGIASSPNGVLLTWVPSQDAAAYIVMRTGSVGLSAAGNPNLVGAIGFVPGGQDYFLDYGQIPLSGTSATQAFARPPGGPTPGVIQVTGAASGPASVAYKITGILPNGVWGTEGTASACTSCAAILNGVNGNKITWTAVAGVPLYAVDRTAALSVTNLGANSLGFIGFATSNASVNGFVDYGQQASTFSLAVQTTPYPTPQTGVAIATAMGSLAAATSVPTLVPVYAGNVS